jgi:hypothetical protein
METIKTPDNLKINPGKGSAFAYESPESLPKLHQNMIIIGARGAGKSCALVNFVERMPYHRTFIVSPTMISNRELMKRLKIKEEDVYADPDDISCLQKIKDKIDEEAREYEQYLEDLKKFEKLQELLTTTNALNTIPDDLLMSFWSKGTFQKPTHKYGGQKPCLSLIFDDCLGSALFSKGSRKLNNMVILHRHLGQLQKSGGALGCSLYFLVQSYKTQSGGLTKSIRNNATSLILFKTKSQKELDEIAEEVGAEVSKDTFMRVVEAAHQEKHSFLMIDLHRKDHHPSAFRKNFDTFLIVPDE